jgi:hypothetical protein
MVQGIPAIVIKVMIFSGHKVSLRIFPVIHSTRIKPEINRNVCIREKHSLIIMKDLFVDQIIALHASIIARDGGDDRLLSEGNLHQLVFRANLIHDTIPRAAFAMYSLVAYPAFRAGNERVAQKMAIWILADGRYTMDAADETYLCRLGEGVLAFTTELQDIEDWLKSHTRETI